MSLFRLALLSLITPSTALAQDALTRQDVMEILDTWATERGLIAAPAPAPTPPTRAHVTVRRVPTRTPDPAVTAWITYTAAMRGVPVQTAAPAPAPVAAAPAPVAPVPLEAPVAPAPAAVTTTSPNARINGWLAYTAQMTGVDQARASHAPRPGTRPIRRLESTIIDRDPPLADPPPGSVAPMSAGPPERTVEAAALDADVAALSTTPAPIAATVPTGPRERVDDPAAMVRQAAIKAYGPAVVEANNDWLPFAVCTYNFGTWERNVCSDLAVGDHILTPRLSTLQCMRHVQEGQACPLDRDLVATLSGMGQALNACLTTMVNNYPSVDQHHLSSVALLFHNDYGDESDFLAKCDQVTLVDTGHGPGMETFTTHVTVTGLLELGPVDDRSAVTRTYEWQDPYTAGWGEP